MKTILEEALYQFNNNNNNAVGSLDFKIASYHSSYMDVKRSPESDKMSLKVNTEKIKKSGSQHVLTRMAVFTVHCTAYALKSSVKPSTKNASSWPGASQSLWACESHEERCNVFSLELIAQAF